MIQNRYFISGSDLMQFSAYVHVMQYVLSGLISLICTYMFNSQRNNVSSTSTININMNRWHILPGSKMQTVTDYRLDIVSRFS